MPPIDRREYLQYSGGLVTFPLGSYVSRKRTGSWTEATEMLYYLAILFDVVKLP